MTRGALFALLIGVALAAGLWLVLGHSFSDPDDPPARGEDPGAEWVAPEEPVAAPDDVEAQPPEPPKPIRERVADAIRVVLSADPNAANPLLDERWRSLLAEAGAPDVLIEQVRSSEDPEEQAAALLLLGLSPDGAAVDLLSSAANGELGEALRMAAVLALGIADPSVSVPVLREIALRDRDLGQVAAAIQVLLSRDPHGTFDLIAQAMGRADGDAEKRRTLYRLMAGEPLEPGEDGVEVAKRYRDQLAPPAGPFLEGSEIDPEGTKKLLSAIEREFTREGSPELRVFAIDALTHLKGEEAAGTFGRILAGLPAEEQIHTVSRINPVENPGMLAEAFRLAPETDVEVRRFITSFLEIPAEPEYLARLQDWRRDETDGALKESLDVAIRRMREALR